MIYQQCSLRAAQGTGISLALIEKPTAWDALSCHKEANVLPMSWYEFGQTSPSSSKCALVYQQQYEFLDSFQCDRKYEYQHFGILIGIQWSDILPEPGDERAAIII